jgi:hypothetical protein
MVRDHGQSLLTEQKSRAAEEIQRLGTAVRSAAERLHDDKSESLARYVETAAEGLDGVARYVEEMSFADLTRTVEQLARRRPALLLGGLFLAGLGVARFIKAGQDPPAAQPRRRARTRSATRRTGRKARRATKD